MHNCGVSDPSRNRERTIPSLYNILGLVFGGRGIELKPGCIQDCCEWGQKHFLHKIDKTILLWHFFKLAYCTTSSVKWEMATKDLLPNKITTSKEVKRWIQNAGECKATIEYPKQVSKLSHTQTNQTQPMSWVEPKTISCTHETHCK